MIDEVRTAFTALRVNPPLAEQNLSVLALASLGGVYVGIDTDHRQHLLLGVFGEPSLPDDVATLSIRSRVLSIGGNDTIVLDITSLFESMAEVFEYFVVAVVERLMNTGETPPSAVSAVLEKWREFLTTGRPALGRDKLAAVFGELLVVLDAVRLSGLPTIDVWAGPYGNRHDFRGGSTALEVKTTRSHTSRRVTIHGEDQLLAPDPGVLYLHFVRLELVPGAGRSVSSIVDELLSAGVSPEALFDALAAAGVPVSQLAATAEITFDVRERLTLPVNEDMPRITPSSFVTGSRPTGIVDISYVVDLDGCLGDALEAGEFQDVVRTMATKAGA